MSSISTGDPCPQYWKLKKAKKILRAIGSCENDAIESKRKMHAIGKVTKVEREAYKESIYPSTKETPPLMANSTSTDVDCGYS